MHSRIFQISTEPIDKENYLNEDTLQQGDGSFYDYCSEIDEEDRKEDIANLVNHALPKGMFELISDDTMRYNGGIEQWKEEYVANIKKERMLLRQIICWNGVRPIISNRQWKIRWMSPIILFGWRWLQSFAEQSFTFMEFVCRLEPGTILYIGGVVDYHF